MKISTIFTIASLSFSLLIFTTSCGSRQFTQGDYDDPDKVRLLNDEFNESDAKQLSQEMITSLQRSPAITTAVKPPVVQMESVRNKTSEHIDTKIITDAI